MSVRTVGISAKQALGVRAGGFPVDERIIVGTRFGDESAAFVAYIDALIRIGGGPPSRNEVELFKQRLANEGATLGDRLGERDVAWLGP